MRDLQNENSVLGRWSQRVSGVWRDFLRMIRPWHSVYKQRQASWQWFLPGKEPDLFCCWDSLRYKGSSGVRLGIGSQQRAQCWCRATRIGRQNAGFGEGMARICLVSVVVIYSSFSTLSGWVWVGALWLQTACILLLWVFGHLVVNNKNMNQPLKITNFMWSCLHGYGFFRM